MAGTLQAILNAKADLVDGKITLIQIPDTVTGGPGPEGPKGDDGYSPIKDVDYFDGDLGLPGTNGDDGNTPIKGVDYVDGINGTNGTNGTNGVTPVKGVNYFDGEQGLKGDKGDPGIQGEAGSGVTLTAVKTDTDIASAISLKHSNSIDHASGSDNQDLSNLVVKVTGSDLLATTEAAKIHVSGSDNQDLSGLVTKVTNKSLVLDTEITKIHSSGSDNQDLSGLEPKQTGKSLSTNDLTSTLKTSYDGAVTHAGSAHAPVGAEVNVNADWNSSSGDSQIMNKPSIPPAQVQTDWNAGTGLGVLLNKPTLSSARLLANLAAPVVTSGTTEKILIQLAIPAARAVSGSTFRAWIMGLSSSTGTLIFKVRAGAGGTITDAVAWTAITSAAQAANKRAGFDALSIVRSATTLYTDGVAYAGSLQLETVIAAAATSAVTISGVWYISLTVICSSGTFTAQVGSIEEIR